MPIIKHVIAKVCVILSYTFIVIIQHGNAYLLAPSNLISMQIQIQSSAQLAAQLVYLLIISLAPVFQLSTALMTQSEILSVIVAFQLAQSKGQAS